MLQQSRRATGLDVRLHQPLEGFSRHATFLLLRAALTAIRTLSPATPTPTGDMSGPRCVEVYLLPRAQPAQRMERGEGREANWLSHPLRREREGGEGGEGRERETAGRQDVDGR